MSTNLTAKAALAYFDDAPQHLGLGVLDWVRDTHGQWNPADNSGDSFDLMVKLGMNVFSVNDASYAMESDGDNGNEVKVVNNGNPKAAMRLAILKVAASVGEFITR